MRLSMAFCALTCTADGSRSDHISRDISCGDWVIGCRECVWGEGGGTGQCEQFCANYEQEL